MKLINFHLSYNWSQDLLRGIFESLEEGELKDLVDEIVPFSQEFSHNLKTILDDDDMKQQGLFSEKPLLLRYKNKEIIDRRSDQEIQDEIDAIENARKKAKEEREAKERAEQERIKKEKERKE
jgi:hypothetical protein|tara:strand:- start:50 stop:418 length:369 start_codon:yes stop_codon:yes gene_type:complete